MLKITLPYQFEPRNYQASVLKAFDEGKRRLVLVHHRRAGKDKLCWNLIIREAWENIGNYYYAFPTYSQGRKAIWEAIGKDGFKYLDHIPKELIVGKPNETEMKIRLKNGSLIQVIGVEDPDRVVGTNPRGIIFSEYSLQNPKAWELLRPILRENGGWAIFNYTPRGRNHGFKLYEMAKGNPSWYVSLLTVDDTKILTPEDIDEERRAGMTEDMIQQEFYCSFIAAVQGSIYWDEIARAEKDGHFKDVPFDPRLLVHTVWDLGRNDTNCIGFYQSNGITVRKIDYLNGNRIGLPDWIKKVKDRGKEKGYIFGRHFAPHDIEVSDYSTTGDASRREIAKEHGIEFEVVPKVSIEEGIDAGRRFFRKLYIDQTNCAEFLEAIPQYSREYDELNKTFLKNPKHDWTSNFADEHRYAGLVHEMFDNDNTSRIIEVLNNRKEREKAKADSGL